jgi:hypothetical protein
VDQLLTPDCLLHVPGEQIAIRSEVRWLAAFRPVSFVFIVPAGRAIAKTIEDAIDLWVSLITVINSHAASDMLQQVERSSCVLLLQHTANWCNRRACRGRLTYVSAEMDRLDRQLC